MGMREFGLGGYGMGRLSGSDIISAMNAIIRQMEGYNPNFAPNNNPGNIVYIGPNQNGQTGVTRGAGGFAKFQSPEAGDAALNNQIQGQINMGQDLTAFFNQYAPGNTKNAAGALQTPTATQNYINFASSKLGIPSNVPLKQVQSGTYDVPVDSTFVASSDVPSDPTTTFDTTTSDSTDPTANANDGIPTTAMIFGVGVIAAGILYAIFGNNS